MNNPTCCGDVIENWALGKAFFVCTGCKQEVFPLPVPLEIIALPNHGYQYPGDFQFQPWTDGQTLSDKKKEETDNGQDFQD